MKSKIITLHIDTDLKKVDLEKYLRTVLSDDCLEDEIILREVKVDKRRADAETFELYK